MATRRGGSSFVEINCSSSVVTSLTVVITDRLRRIAQTKHRCDELRTYTPPRPHHNKTESLPAMDPTRHRRTRRGVRSSNKLGRWGRGGIGLSLCRHVRPAYCMVSPRVWCHHTTKLHAKLGFTARLHASGADIGQVVMNMTLDEQPGVNSSNLT